MLPVALPIVNEYSGRRRFLKPAARTAGTAVILMPENRSFDHYFGTTRGVRGFGDRRPVPSERQAGVVPIGR
jgi:hypothetical protein